MHAVVACIVCTLLQCCLLKPECHASQSKLLGLKAIEAARVWVSELGLEDQLQPDEFLEKRETALDLLFPSAELLPGAGTGRILNWMPMLASTPCPYLKTGAQRGDKRSCQLPAQTSHIHAPRRSVPAERLIRHLHRHGIPACLATSSNVRGFAKKTTNHGALFSLFTHKVTGDEVNHGKPHPEIFLTAASRFAPPAQPGRACLVFEDAPAGVQAAVAAGMSVCTWGLLSEVEAEDGIES